MDMVLVATLLSTALFARSAQLRNGFEYRFWGSIVAESFADVDETVNVAGRKMSRLFRNVPILNSLEVSPLVDV